jgi:hypothetical protein
MNQKELASKLAELEAKKKAIKDKADAEISAVKKELASKLAKQTATERRLRAQTIKAQKKVDDHAKIVLGVAVVAFCRQHEQAAKSFLDFLPDFYKDAQAKLEAAQHGLTLAVVKPISDTDRDA